MKLSPSILKLGSAFDTEPKRILFGKSEKERKKFFDKQFSLLVKYWDTIPWRQWGVGSAKSLGDFLREVGYGESVLVEEAGMLVRKLDIVAVFVLNDKGQWLLEDKQQFSDGRIRKRRFPYISEKLINGETPFETARRAVQEETGGHILGNPDQFIKGEKTLLDQNHAYNTGSSSYPGIMSIKNIYTYAYIVSPQEYKKNYIEVDSGGVITSHVWRDITENHWFTGTKLEREVRNRLGR